MQSDGILLVMYHGETENIEQSGLFYEKIGIITFINNANNVTQILRIKPITN